MTRASSGHTAASNSPRIKPAALPYRGWRAVLAALALAGLAAGVSSNVDLDSRLGADLAPSAGAPAANTVREVEVAELSLVGLEDGSVHSAAALEATQLIIAAPDPWTRSLQITVDGVSRPPTEAELLAGEVVIDGAALVALGEGEHAIVATAGEDTRTTGATELTVSFTLDTTAPVVTLPTGITAAGLKDPLVVEVAVEGGTAQDTTLDAPGGEVVWAAAGPVSITYPRPPASVVVTATDVAGNTSTVETPVVVPFPGGRAVHTTPSAWRYSPKREPIIAMLEAGLIDAVQMDIKDEIGDVSWDTDIEWAGLNGSEDFNRNFDMAAAIEQIHSYGARVIGRLTVYRDHRLAQWAWENGRPDLVVQGKDGQPYAGRYGQYAFTNFAHPEVQQYNLDIALEAAELGFDDILYDYIRRPDGAIDKLVIPGIGERTPEEAVVEVMATAYPLLRERGLWVGASVFGIAIDRPTQMAQDIPMMAEHVDYIAPMVYPNHWNLGEYGVPDPNKAPYDIVERSLALYQEVLEPTGTALMPWLQDFGGYGEAQVRAQIDATEAVTGQRSFLLWASSATYTEAALDPIPIPAPAPAAAPDGQP